VNIRLNSSKRQKLLNAMRLDKKVSGGEIKFVLAEKIGKVAWGGAFRNADSCCAE